MVQFVSITNWRALIISSNHPIPLLTSSANVASCLTSTNWYLTTGLFVSAGLNIYHSCHMWLGDIYFKNRFCNQKNGLFLPFCTLRYIPFLMTWSHAQTWEGFQALLDTYANYVTDLNVSWVPLCFIFFPPILMLKETKLGSVNWWAPSSLAARCCSMRLRGEKRVCCEFYLISSLEGIYDWVLAITPVPPNIPSNMALSGFLVSITSWWPPAWKS